MIREPCAQSSLFISCFQERVAQLGVEYVSRSPLWTPDFFFCFIDAEGSATLFPIHRELALAIPHVRSCVEWDKAKSGRVSDRMVFNVMDFVCGDLMQPSDVHSFADLCYGLDISPGDETERFRRRLVHLEIALRLHSAVLVNRIYAMFTETLLPGDYLNYTYRLCMTYLEQAAVDPTVERIAAHRRSLANLRALMSRAVSRTASILAYEYRQAKPGSFNPIQFTAGSALCDDLLADVMRDERFPTHLMDVDVMAKLHAFSVDYDGQLSIVGINLDAIVSQYIFEFLVVIGAKVDVSGIFQKLIYSGLDYHQAKPTSSLLVLKPYSKPAASMAAEETQAPRRVAYLICPTKPIKHLVAPVDIVRDQCQVSLNERQSMFTFHEVPATPNLKVLLLRPDTLAEIEARYNEGQFTPISCHALPLENQGRLLTLSAHTIRPHSQRQWHLIYCTFFTA